MNTYMSARTITMIEWACDECGEKIRIEGGSEKVLPNGWTQTTKWINPSIVNRNHFCSTGCAVRSLSGHGLST